MNRLLTVAALLQVTFSAGAHNTSAKFDKEQYEEVTATDVEFKWTNPHVWIEIEIENDEGDTEAWSIEGLGPNSLFRAGWRPNSFEAGDVITIRFNPMRDGSQAGGFIGARFADGSTIGRWQ